MIPLIYQIAAQVFSLCVGVYVYHKRSVSLSGAIALLLISSTYVWLYHIDLLFIVFFMFASSSILSKIKQPFKEESTQVIIKSGPRDFIQAFANLGIAFLMMLIYHFNPQEIYLFVFISSIAAANADSWASEIGSLMKKPPVSILTGKPVQKGLSGGVNLVGAIAALLGSCFISFSAYFFLQQDISIEVILLCSGIGFIGYLFDSFLGATVQVLYYEDKLKRYAEIPSATSRKIKGVRFVTNDTVNFLTTVLAGFLAYFLI